MKILSINSIKPISIIHAQDSGNRGLAAIIAGKILDIPVIITLDGIRYEQIATNPDINELIKKIALKIENKLDVITLRNADITTIVSPAMKGYVEEIAPKAIIVYIPVAIVTKNFKFSEEKKS